MYRTPGQDGSTVLRLSGHFTSRVPLPSVNRKYQGTKGKVGLLNEKMMIIVYWRIHECNMHVQRSVNIQDVFSWPQAVLNSIFWWHAANITSDNVLLCSAIHFSMKTSTSSMLPDQSVAQTTIPVLVQQRNDDGNENKSSPIIWEECITTRTAENAMSTARKSSYTAAGTLHPYHDTTSVPWSIGP